MLLTVAIPNYNGAKYIESAIRSCRHIKLAPSQFEILVVENASSDHSSELVRSLQKDVPNLRMVANHKTLNRLANWLRCFEVARGKYLHYLFVTDLFHKSNDLHNQVDTLEQNNDVSICLSSIISQYSPESYKKSKALFDRKIQVSSLALIKDFVEKGILPFGALQSNLFRVEDIKNHHISFNETIAYRADNIFCAEAALKRCNVYFTPNPSIIWRIYMNPNRFHSNLTVQEMVKNDIEAFDIISRLAAEISIDFKRIYSAELRSIINHRIYHRRLLSRNSNYAYAVRILLNQLKTNKIPYAVFAAHFISATFQRLLMLLTAKLMPRKGSYRS